MTIKVLVIDDEPLAQDIIRKYADDLKNIEIKGYCNDALEAIQVLNTQTIDLLILDINMPKLSGIEFLKTIERPPLVILTTAYTEYALEGYELNIVDYLVKPFSLSRFIKSIQKAEKLLLLMKTQTTSIIADSVFIKSNKKSIQVKFNDIVYIEGLGDYINIYTEKTHWVTNISMKKMEELLPIDQFIRIHKSNIVNLKKIIAIDGNMVEIGNKKLAIGNNYRVDFFAQINKLSI
jgi:DNA-binding LytR/AlgR family response regulator